MLLSDILAGMPAQIVRDVDVAGFGPLNMTGEGLLHWFANPRFEHQLTALSGKRAILSTWDLEATIPAGFGLALCADPKEVFLKAYRRHGAELEAAAPFANQIDATARIHPRAVIADHSVRIGANVSIGANAVIHERVTIEEDAIVGANTVLGGEGFEVGVIDGLQIVVPHYGSVIVRRGAVIMTSTSVDWGIYGGVTEVGEGAVVDNLCHIAHNVKIGRNCQIIACVMIGGSTVIGDDARIGPNATVSNGLTIGRGARVTLGAVVTRDVEDGGHVTGNFALPHAQFMENLRKAPGMTDAIDDLAALLKLDRAALEAAVPGIDVLSTDERLFGLLPLIAASAQRKSTASEADSTLRAQILRYQAAELMTDRERAAFFGLPEGCRIRERAKILAPEKFICGKNVWIGEGAMLDAQGGLTIGDGTQIGGGVFVWTHSSHQQALHGETCVSQEHIVYKPTTIGSNCFIVGPTVISAGVTIGDGAMISPLTFIDRDVAPGEHVAGPKTVKMLEKRIEALEQRLAAREE